MRDETILLDACHLLNLYGTGEIASILQRLPYRFVASQRGCQEALWIRVEGEKEREHVDLQPVIDAGWLTVETLLSQKEADLFVEFGLLLDDGEAEALSLAVARGYAFGTDDRKARRIARERLVGTRLWSTLELLHEWQTQCSLPSSPVGEALRRMTYRSSYRPGRSDPLWTWWITHLEGNE